ncbi:hydroxyisourate hydrolase [Polytolypa hystricis UAMH7299]|uniref:5-hydroxyisourate hydrolase n=1 Tax=Polytolypa hystricis (strain UAMH7299) TaxID=1447883 RepID=A0A2B7YCV4_POLH7|nr:hydroxyisourate hydrolase [Polytolypa hystricis UAMH7299]
MADRDPITCHVLNTLNGTPAAGLSCTLTLIRTELPEKTSLSPQTPTFHATTDSDGRVKTWLPSDPSPSHASLNLVFAAIPGADEIRTVWSLRIDNVGKWYEERGVESFWPEVEVKFVVNGKESEAGWRHYHVPVLLGPWNYSTYRGS